MKVDVLLKCTIRAKASSRECQAGGRFVTLVWDGNRSRNGGGDDGVWGSYYVL